MLTRRLCSLLYLFLIFVLSALLLTHRTQTDLPLVSRRPPNPFPAAAKNAAGPRLVSSVVAHLPLSFEENRGQAGSEAEFVSRGPGYSLALSGRSAVLVHRAKVRLREGDWLSQMASFANPDQSVSSRVQLTWLGANPNARAEGVDRQQGTSNYLLGNDPKKWRTEVPRFGSVRFASVYRGIDLVYHGNQDRIEMDYVVAPNADPRAIRMAVGGPSIVEIEPNGNLSISGEGDEVTLKAPVAYQEIHGQRQTVNARFVLESSHTVALVLGNYDPSQQLTIDPVLDYSASFGGGDDIIADVVTDSQGYVYLAGTTCSTSYPTTGSALQQNLGDSPEAYACNDAIVTKLDPTASSLIYSTYIGGSNADFAVRLNVDGSGNVILAGSTNSPNFPTTSGAYLTSLKKNNCTFSPYIVNQQCSDGFLLKLDPTGSTLLFSTLLGGERADFILALAVDSPSGNIYVAGATNSVTFPIAVPASAPQPAYGGDNGTCQMVTGIPFTVPCFDAFVAEFNPQGTQLIASTYLGGNDDDGAFAMAIDSNHSVYVTGDTDSAGFPVTMGAYQTVHTPGDQRDVFVTKLNSSLSSLAYSTFIGGSSDDYPMMIRVDSGGNAYVTGSTASADYPTTSGALQTIYAGPSTDDCPATLEEVDIGALYCGDVFVTKLSPAGNSLVFSTYFGTSQDDGGLNLALDSSQNVWVIGGTHSSSFPLTPDAYYNSQTFSTSAFLAEIKSDGTQNLFSTMIPGQLGLGLEVDSSNNVIVAGEYPMSGYAATATPGTYNDGQGGVFLLKFSPGTAQSGVTLSSTSSLFASNTIQFPYTQPDSASATVPVTLQNTGTGTLHLSISIATPPFGGSAQPFIQTNNCGSSVLPSQSCTIQVLYEPTGISGSDSAAIVIQDDAPGAPHTITLGGQSDYSLTASFIPTTLNFGRLQPGVTSTSLSAFLNGTGDIYAKTTGAPFVSGNTSDFIVNTTNCGIGLSFCSIQAQFSPQSGESGVRTAQVSVPTNAPNSPQVLTLTGNATSGPALTFNINPLTFSAADVGTSRSSAILLMNTGGADLNITGLNFSNPAFSYDALFGTCGQTPSVAQPMILHAQGTCTFSVTFAPTATGLQTGTVTFTDNDPASPTLNVSGQASSPTGPHLSLIATPNPQPDGSMAFADTVVGQSTAPIAALITVLNLSPGGQVQVTNLTLSPDYTLSQPCGTLPIVITSGNACTFNVYFSPQAAGPRPGTLTIQTDAPGGVTFTQKFTGNGVMIPAVNLSSTKLDFGKQVVNQTSSPMTSILTNTGGAPLSIGNIAITPPFTQTNNCPRPLAAGASCVFSVKFTSPTQSGPATGQLTFSANAAGGSYVIGLSGSGITGPVLAAQPASLNFNGQAIGTTSAAQSVTLQNVGDTAVSVTSIHTMANFKQTNNCPATLAPAAACTINVSFTPSTNNFADFPVSGSVLVDNNGTGSPLAVPLAGTALGVTAATSSTLLGSSANPSIIGQQLTLTATITSGTAGTPSGYVSFYDGTTEIGAGLLSSQAIATYQTTALYLGTHSITAQYSGDSTYGPSTSNIVTQFVVEGAKTSSTTALVSSLNPSTTGQSVTFTATVTPPSGTPVPTGSVTFLDG
ncbi:MAG: choice-of-anchor D domain-containing protein, partial [Candidatus Acidiferrales bacterium]